MRSLGLFKTVHVPRRNFPTDNTNNTTENIKGILGMLLGFGTLGAATAMTGAMLGVNAANGPTTAFPHHKAAIEPETIPSGPR